MKNKGYGLYVKSKGLPVDEHDLNTHGEYVPYQYIVIQKHIEKILTSHKFLISLAFNFDESKSTLIAGFGLFLNIKDGKGREGVHYVHAVELNEVSHLFSVVLHFVRMLNTSSIMEFYFNELNSITNNEDEFSIVIDRLCDRIEDCEYIGQEKVNVSNKRPEFAEIIHDCSGGSAMAWLTFAKLATNRRSNWDVYDVIESNRLITKISPPTSSKSILASELFYCESFSYLDSPKVEVEANVSQPVPVENENSVFDQPKEDTPEIELKSFEGISESNKDYIKYFRPPLAYPLAIAIIASFVIYILIANLVKSEIAQLKIELVNNNNQYASQHSGLIKNNNEIKTLVPSLKMNEQEKLDSAKRLIDRVLYSIGSQGNRLTISELMLANEQVGNFDEKTAVIIKNLIQNFQIYDSNKSFKLESNEVSEMLN